MPLKHTIREIELPRGGKGLIVNVPGSTVMSYTIHFRAGNDYVKSPEIHQTAHLMEHLAFGPNEAYGTMESFSQEFSRNGAYSNASTYDTNMHYYADCAQFEWERILKLQELAITKPRFLSENLEAEKGNVKEEFGGYAHNNNRRLWQRINRATGGHSLLDEEKVSTIDPVTVEDIVEHHARTHTRRNMRFVLAGDFGDNGDTAISLLDTWELPRGERLAPLIDHAHAAPPLSLKRADQENSTFGLTMMHERKLEIPEQVALSALNHLLTGTLHSRIWGTARAKGICYGMGSNASSDINGTSSWDFYGQVRDENATALYELIEREIARVIRGEISDLDIEEARQFLVGDYQMRGQTVSALAGWYSGDYFFDDTIDDINNADKHIAAVTKEAIIELAREFITAKTWTLGEIGAVDEMGTAKHYKVLESLFQA